MAQTAVSWLIEQLEEKGDLTENTAIRIVQLNIDTSDYLEIKRQAKAMEKEQIVEAYGVGADCDNEWAEDYYNKTYNK